MRKSKKAVLAYIGEGNIAEGIMGAHAEAKKQIIDFELVFCKLWSDCNE